jgi:PAS domain S-box-containing protein
VLAANEEPPQPPLLRGEQEWQEWIEKLVRSRIIENWESQDEPEHLRTIRDRILRIGDRTARRLGLYKQILQDGEVEAEDSPERMELSLSGLVVKQLGKLTVYNGIYAAVFDQSWVDRALADLRPYAEALAAWIASNHDESHLLRGQVLRDTQRWATSKSLSNEDYKFLNASQELESREFQKLFEAIQKGLSDGFILTDKTGKIVEANEMAKQLLGFSAQDRLDGQSLRELLQFKDGNFAKWFQNAVEAVDPQQYYADRTLFSKGTEQQHSVNLSLKTVADASDNAKVIGVLVVMEDISNEKRLKSTMYRYMTQELAEELLKLDDTKLGDDRIRERKRD